MKAKEFGAWPPHNDFKSGQRYSANGYNKSFKKERFPSVQEYANRDLDEYHRFEETKDFTKEPAAQKSDGNRSNQSKKTDNANKMRQRVLQQAVGIVVGSTVVVTSYQAQVEEREKQQVLEPTVAVTETVDMAVTEDDILDEIIVQEADNSEQTAAVKSDSSQSRGGSGNGGRSGGRSGGSSTGSSSAAANSDMAETDAQEADVQETDVPETEDFENIEENEENLPDNQEDNNDSEDVTDVDGQDINPSDDENSENDNSETETPFAEEVKKETPVVHRSSKSYAWEWDLENNSASFIIKNGSGSVTSSTEVTTEIIDEIDKTYPATCTEDGKITYKAKVIIGGNEYTDIKEEILPALGHSFGSGQEIIVGGKKFIQFECSHCGKHLRIGNSISEE